MNDFRLREPTENPEVHKYVFSDKDNSARYTSLAARYETLVDKARASKDSLSAEEKQEMGRILREVTEYKEAQRAKIKSVLASSLQEDPIGAGKDNRVVSDNGDERGYVYKYSVESYKPSPETVEYLVKKYKMLKKFLGEWIPDSRFILGERRVDFDKKKFHKTKVDNRTHAITIQRKVEGKTLSKMTKTEKTRTDLLRQLKEAHAKYILLKGRIQWASQKLSLPETTLDIKLDLGGLSKKDDLASFDVDKIAEFSTPNIMYDDIKEKLYFIDFDMNEWNEDKQKVYDLVMSDEEL